MVHETIDLNWTLQTGAGAADWNGIYSRGEDINGQVSFSKDNEHEIYNHGGVWRLADYGVATYYVANVDGPAENAMPPKSGYTVTGGSEPTPQLDLGPAC
eukprot:SAG31_NODE_433_length_15750_cov_6.132579_6_plen_100_part_00